jgi:hypothetical protein
MASRLRSLSRGRDTQVLGGAAGAHACRQPHPTGPSPCSGSVCQGFQGARRRRFCGALAVVALVVWSSHRAEAQTPLVCGQVANGSIDTPQELDLFTFSAEAGDTIALTFVRSAALDPGFNVLLELYGPTSTTRIHTQFPSLRNVDLPATGTYTIRVFDFGLTRRGTYSLALAWLFPAGKRCGDRLTLGCGQVITASIAPLEQDTVTFAAEAGDTIALTFVQTAALDPGFNVLLELYGPTSTTRIHTQFPSLRNVELPATGTYTIRVFDFGSSRRGTYSLALAWLFPASKRCGDRLTLGCGQVITGSIAPLEQDTVTFAAEAGDTIALTFVQTAALDPGFNVLLELYGPTSTTRIHTQFPSLRNVDLPATGSYTIRVFDFGLSRRGNYSLGLSWLFPPAKQACDTDGDTLPDGWETQFGLDPGSATGPNGGAGDPDADGQTNLQEFQAGTHPRGFFRRFLPEGADNEFFDARFAVLNVGNAPGRLLFRFLQSDGGVLSHFITLPQNRRLTIDATVLSQLTTPDFSTALESDQPIVLDRTMTWANGLGSHAETGVPSPTSTWYLAEGATAGDFSLFYLLQNPNPAATVATVKYLLPDGLAPITMTYPLAANSRTTIFVDVEDPRLAQTAVSAVITTPSNAPIIVERAMYRSTPTQDFAAGHGSSGVTAPATHWFFAEGATGPFFDCFILLANPGTQAAQVTINYLLDDGRTFTKGYPVPAEGRYTVYLDAEEIPAGSGIRPLEVVAVSSTVSSDVPIIAERAMWWPGPAMGGEVWTEAHNSPGATLTGTRWALAEGEVGGAQAAETYILIANTSDTGGSARVTLYFADGTSAERTFPLLPRSRRNVSVSSDYPDRPMPTFSAVIESLAVAGGAPAQIVVERAMYTSPGGLTWTAGTNALATRLAP